MPRQLEIRDLSVNYGEIPVVRHLTLSVAEGEVVALLGANGAGKSTTLRAVMGMVPPIQGAILVNGENVTGRPPHTVARRGIALVPEGRRIFKRMTVHENLQIGGVTRSRAEISGLMAGVFALFARLKEREYQVAGTLSGGEQQMLAIGRALMSKPDFILFDEPSLGLAPRIVESVFDAIRRISRELGIGGILVEQKIDAALNLVERAHVLSRGAVVLSGAAALLRGSARLQEAYLGTLNQEVTDVVRR